MHFVGNTMIDTLVALEDRFRGAESGGAARASNPASYALVTLHRPALVDGPAAGGDDASASAELAREMPVVFPVHPRTRKMMEALDVRAPGPAALRAARLPRLPLARWPTPAPSSPTPAASRRRRPTSASPASPCATTPSGRSRSRAGTNTLLGLDPAAIAEHPAALASAPGEATRAPAALGRPRRRANRRRRRVARRAPAVGPLGSTLSDRSSDGSRRAFGERVFAARPVG